MVEEDEVESYIQVILLLPQDLQLQLQLVMVELIKSIHLVMGVLEAIPVLVVLLLLEVDMVAAVVEMLVVLAVVFVVVLVTDLQEQLVEQEYWDKETMEKLLSLMVAEEVVVLDLVDIKEVVGVDYLLISLELFNPTVEAEPAAVL